MARVSDLFDVSYGHSMELNALEQSDAADAVNFVSRTAKNNGVSARVAPVAGETPSPARTLSVALGGTVLETFLQPAPYFSGRDIAVLQSRRDMSDEELLFWATAIRMNAYRYSYGRQANRTLGSVVLPDKLPEWFSSVKMPNLDAASKTRGQHVPLSAVSEWKKFRVADLFTVKRGKFATSQDGANPDDPFVPLVSATSLNNGISKMVQTQAAEQAGTVTVSINGSIGEVFHQPQPYVASSDVVVLSRPDDASPLTANMSLFVAAVLRCEKYRYNYGRKWKQGTLADTSIPLPATEDGQPDWEWMDTFMDGQPFSNVETKGGK